MHAVDRTRGARRTSVSAILAGLLIVVIGAGGARAQEQRGALEGIVKDNTGAVLPGVTVDARHIERGSVTSTTTDEQGAFRFPALPPGAYAMTATLSSFAPARLDRVDVALGEIKRLELSLGVAGVTETVHVDAEQPLIDVKQSQRATSITAEQFQKLPRGRDFSTIVTIVPGANQEPRSGGITIDGSSASENRFIIDGVETTNPQNGTQGSQMTLDFVGEVQVKSSGYAAEYGGSTGGVINVISRSGSNTFRGDAGFYFTGDQLQSDPRPTLRLSPTSQRVAEHVTYAEDGFRQFDPGVSLGGPILRDKLWFFTAYAPGLDKTTRTAPLSDGTAATRAQHDRRQFFTTNVTSQFMRGATAKLAYSSSYRTRAGVLPNQNGSSSPQTAFDAKNKFPNYTLSGYFNYAASDRLFFGVSGGLYHQNEFTEGLPDGTRFQFPNSTNIGLAGVPAALQRPVGFASQSPTFAIDRNRYDRLDVQADASYYGRFMGQHTLKGGVQIYRIANDVLEGETWGNRIRLRWNQELTGAGRGTFGYYEVRSNGVSPDKGFVTEGNVSNTRLGLFVQDTWTIRDRLTLNLGLRTENEGVPAYTTEGVTQDVAIDWGFGDKLASRLGFAWDLAGNGRTKLFGNWSFYYDIFKMELPRGSFGGDKWLDYYYALDTPDWPSLDVAGCPPACPGRLLEGPVDLRHPATDNIDPSLDPMRQQELVLGAERELTTRMAVSARYIHKQIDRAIEDIGGLDDQHNEIYRIGNPGFGANAVFFDLAGGAHPLPKAVRDYDALELSFDRRLSNRWSFRGSYTLSTLFGSYSGLSQSDELGRTAPNVGRNFDYPVMSFDGAGRPIYGRLATDRPHQLKLQGLYILPFGILAGLDVYGASGIPVTREAAVHPPNLFPVQYLGRGSDGRTPQIWTTDLFLGHEFHFGGSSASGTGGGRKVLQLHMTVMNLFDADTAIDKFVTETSAGVGLPLDETAFYDGRYDFTSELAKLGPTAIDPRFLLDRSFLAQRAIRVGAKFRF